jgi:2-C-methyl-D-erythritol 4-phosphate cytidylyltransferase
VTSALLVAAGQSTRMGLQTDKLFLPVAGRPLAAHAWRCFDAAPSIGEIVLVVREGLQEAFARMAATFRFDKPFRLVAGGRRRQDSVWNGLQALSPSADIVAIHDAARPCASLALIEATIQAARQIGAAVAAQPVSDTVKASDDGQYVSRHLDRSLLWAVQTPQTFRVEIIRRALQAVRERGLQVTDDTAACEIIGQRVKLVCLPGPNPKVTVPGDIPYVELLLQSQSSAPTGGGA